MSDVSINEPIEESLDNPLEASLWDHLSELRQTLLHCLIAIFAAVFLCLFFYQSLFAFIKEPLHHLSPSPPLQFQELKKVRVSNPTSTQIFYHSQGHIYPVPPHNHIEVEKLTSYANLAVFGPIEGMLIALKVCFWAGVVLSSPVWLYLILRFIGPALKPHETRLVVPFLSLSACFLALGGLFAYFITIPLANSYLLNFNESLGVNFWSLENYMSYTFFLMLANAFACELGVILFFLVHLGILTAETMVAKRRHMVVLAFILGALLTPPDVLTQVMLAVPLICLYEATLLYAKWMSYRKKATSPLPI